MMSASHGSASPSPLSSPPSSSSCRHRAVVYSGLVQFFWFSFISLLLLLLAAAQPKGSLLVLAFGPPALPQPPAASTSALLGLRTTKGSNFGRTVTIIAPHHQCQGQQQQRHGKLQQQHRLVVAGRVVRLASSVDGAAGGDDGTYPPNDDDGPIRQQQQASTVPQVSAAVVQQQQPKKNKKQTNGGRKNQTLLESMDEMGLALKPRAVRAAAQAAMATKQRYRVARILQASVLYSLFILYRAYRGFFVLLPAVFREVYRKMETVVDRPFDGSYDKYSDYSKDVDGTLSVRDRDDNTSSPSLPARITVALATLVITLSYVATGALRVLWKLIHTMTHTSDIPGSFAAAAMEQENNEDRVYRLVVTTASSAAAKAPPATGVAQSFSSSSSSSSSSDQSSVNASPSSLPPPPSPPTALQSDSDRDVPNSATTRGPKSSLEDKNSFSHTNIPNKTENKNRRPRWFSP